MPDAAEARLSRRLLASIRVRVTVAATVAVIVVLVAAGIALVAAQRQQLVDRVDETVEQRLAELAAAFSSQTGGRAFAGRGADTVGQLIAPDGRVLASSSALEGKRAMATAPFERGPHTVHDVPLEVGDYRLVAREVATADGRATLLVAGSLDDVAESTGAVRRSLLIGIPVVAAIFAALVWLLVGRLLHRVVLATDAQQRFVADASHELRTPIARMRTELEVDLAHPEIADPIATHHSLLEETLVLQHLTDDLLLLARSDSGVLTVRREAVDLEAVVLAECRAASVPDRVALDTSRVVTAQVRGDASQLARAFRNALENALRHAHSTVAVNLGHANGSVRVGVLDDGPGVAPKDRERIFERFTRLDDARGLATGGSGLGLAITREIVEHHGGRAWVEAPSGGGTMLCITLPASRDRADSGTIR